MSNKVVRLRQGDPNQLTVYSDNPLSVAENWESAGADLIHVVDLDATLTNGHNLNMISNISQKVSIPVQVGGGIRSMKYAERVLESGVDRIVIGTLAFKNRKLLLEMRSKFGSDRIIISLDYSDEQVMIDGWRSGTGMKLLDSLKAFEIDGVEIFLLTSIKRDGMLDGPDVETLRKVVLSTSADIQASGGFRSIEDLSMVKEIGIGSAIIGKALYDGRLNLDLLVREFGGNKTK